MRHADLKPLSEQVLVITGGSSGIGLTTARLAVEHGARVVLAARNEQVQQRIVDELNDLIPEHAVAVIADVSQEADVRRIADTAVNRFGGFDTWVNNAAVSIYGPIMEIPLEDQRRLFEVNYWGYVYGSRIAIEHLRDRDHGRGGALINVGSVIGDRAIPDQGPYCASKHAIKGFTEALRMEVEQEGWPVSISLIKPSSIDTPYKAHAKNLLERKPKNPPPVYAPQTVAKAILHCAQYPRRDVFVGGGGRAVAAIGWLLPRLTDLVMERTMRNLQMTDTPAEPIDREHHSLYKPIEDGDERGHYPHYVHETSAYTLAALHPYLTAAATLAAGLVARQAWQMLAGEHDRGRPVGSAERESRARHARRPVPARVGAARPPVGMRAGEPL
ncbi:MAG: SDR family oxidoreductase [Phycisphaeraceae bacterium]